MQRQKGIYVAVLNQGNISTELVTVLNDLVHQGQKYKLAFTYPLEKPITFNRNKIVQDFLPRKDFDYLMMIDSDIVPPVNILNLADFNLDIVTPLMFAYQQNTLIPLVLQLMPDGLYSVLPFKGNEGLVEVDSVGTGCIFIKREVLEHPDMRHPFRNEYDADGMKKYGQDLAFTRRAKAAGFKAYCHLDYPCSHWTRFDLKKAYGSISYLEHELGIRRPDGPKL